MLLGHKNCWLRSLEIGDGTARQDGEVEERVVE